MLRIKHLLPLAALSCFVGASCVTIQMPGSNASPRPTAQPTAQATQPTPLPTTSATVNGKTISGDMNDEQILAAFDIDIKSAEKSVSRGPDGFSTTYKNGQQEVGITRSYVTGVYVYASGPIKGEWKLGGGH